MADEMNFPPIVVCCTFMLCCPNFALLFPVLSLPCCNSNKRPVDSLHEYPKAGDEYESSPPGGLLNGVEERDIECEVEFSPHPSLISVFVAYLSHTAKISVHQTPFNIMPRQPKEIQNGNLIY